MTACAARLDQGLVASVLLGIATIGAYGAVHYSFGVLMEPIRAETEWSTGQLAGT